MELRPYQREFNDAVLRDFAGGHQRVMGVAATGAGKTIMAADMMQKWDGNCLFLADAKELVKQNAKKFFDVTGEIAGVDMGAHVAVPHRDRVVVATSQSIFRRLEKYGPDYFSLIIVDECHRNTLGEMSSTTLNYFKDAKILGVTATPYRSDRQQLGDFYETISINVGLDRLIREGFLSRIHIKSVPMQIDLRDIRGSGDYNAFDLDKAITPILREAAKHIVEHAADRKKIVIFLPMINTSMRMQVILQEMGIEAAHVSGVDRSEMEHFVEGNARVICNAQLLTTGWDCPSVDCIVVLRPTKSLSLYQQMVGRGTRPYSGKENLLLLDPLFLTDDHKLISPARLICRDEEAAKAMQEKIEQEGGGDLLVMEEDVELKRAEALRARIKENEKKKARVVDAVEFALNAGSMETAEFQPEFGWESSKPSQKQLDALERAGFDIDGIETRGQASKILDLLFLRREKGLASPKQLRLLKRFNHPSPAIATFQEASDFIDHRIGGAGATKTKPEPAAPPVTDQGETRPAVVKKSTPAPSFDVRSAFRRVAKSSP